MAPVPTKKSHPLCPAACVFHPVSNGLRSIICAPSDKRRPERPPRAPHLQALCALGLVHPHDELARWRRWPPALPGGGSGSQSPAVICPRSHVLPSPEVTLEQCRSGTEMLSPLGFPRTRSCFRFPGFDLCPCFSQKSHSWGAWGLRQ